MNRIVIKKIRLRDHLAESWQFIFTFALFLVYTVPTFSDWIGIESIPLNIGVSILCLILAPQLCLHLQYWLQNNYFSLIIDNDKKSVTISTDSTSGEFFSDDFESITLVCNGVNGVVNKLPWFPWQSYRYLLINLKSGGSILLTCLLVDDAGWLLKSEHFQVQTAIYCWPPHVNHSKLLQNKKKPSSSR